MEGVVDARPLTYLYDDSDGINFTLTPSLLINGHRLWNTPNSSHFEIVSTHESLTRKSRHPKRLLNHFAETWRKDYLVSLLQTHAASSRTNRALELLLVTWCCFRIIQLRVLWKLVVVEELLPGSNDRIRAAVAQVVGSRTLYQALHSCWSEVQCGHISSTWWPKSVWRTTQYRTQCHQQSSPKSGDKWRTITQIEILTLWTFAMLSCFPNQV